jgi:hypothetical protein
MIDPLHREAGVQDVPSRAFIGMHGRPRCDMLADRRDCIGLAINNPRPRIAAALSGDNHNLPLGIHAAMARQSETEMRDNQDDGQPNLSATYSCIGL